MNNPPAFQFYAADYLADENVTVMTLEEEGAYWRAVAYCWREGSIPADDDRLSRLLKGASTTVLRVVRKCFNQSSTTPDRLVHPRLEKERLKQAEWRAKSAAGGKLSGKVRRAKKLRIEPPFNHPSRMVEPPYEPNANSSSSSSSTTKAKEKGEKEKPSGATAPAPPPPTQTATDENLPDELSIVSLGEFFLNQLSIPKNRKLGAKFASCVDLLARDEQLSREQAALTLLRRAREHPRDDGNWSFWLVDGGWKLTKPNGHGNGRATVGVHGIGAFSAEAIAEREQAIEELERQSYLTWLSMSEAHRQRYPWHGRVFKQEVVC